MNTIFNLHSSFSFILSIALLFGASSAWAADWTDADDNTYTALKSLKGNGDGKGYLVTDIVPNCTDIVMMKFKPATVSSSYPGAYFCARDASANGMFTCYRPSNKIRLDRGASNWANQKTSTGTISTSYEYLLTADYGRRTATIIQDGSSSDLFGQMLGGDASYTVGSPLAFFALHKGLEQTSFNSFERGYIYYFELYDSNTNLTHCLMPAQRNTDSVYGFYDTRTRTFYPQSGGVFTPVARTVTVTGTCKKWTGLGADNKMSTEANWENNDKPAAGDDVDFTLAAPLAEINADMNVTFGKVWIDDGDLPGFTGTLTATAVSDLTRMQAYDTAIEAFTFTLAAQDFTWNGGAAANWNTTDALWLCNSAASVWYDNNNAIFNTADATATLTAYAEVNSLAFNQNATVAGSATLTVPSVVVAADVSATISAPTAGALEKTGAGILTLASSRADQTTLSEGTLALSGTASLDWSKFTFGTDPAKPVTLEFGTTAAFSSVPSTWKIGNEANITSTIVKNGGDWTTPTHIVIGNANGASTTFINESGNFTSSDNFRVGDNGSATLVVNRGTAGSTSSSSLQVWVGYTGEGTLVVTNGGVFSAKESLYVARSANGTINVADGGRVHAGADIVFNYYNADGGGVVNLGRGGVVEANRAYRNKAGSLSFNFDGGTFKKESDNGNIFPAEADDSAVAVTVSENGGTLDNNALAVALPCTITGEGGMTLSGSGTTTISANQSYLGTTTVSNETTLSVSGGVKFAGPVVFNEDSALDIAGYNGTTPLSATAITFPDEGTVALTLDSGAFDTGVYKICAADDLTAADGEKFSIDTGDKSHVWSMHDNTLILTVGTVDPNAWTGLAGDGKMSSAANWAGYAVPAAGEDIDLSGISADTTIIADANRTFGAVTMGDGVITFTSSFAAESFSDTSKVAVGADSTVTINGDLVFSWSDESAHPICNNVAAGGVFRVTGSIIADSANRGYIVPCPGSIDGTIAAAGLVNNSRNNDDVFRLVRGLTGSSVNWEIGAAGFSGTKRFVVSGSGSHATIRAAANFTVSATIVQYRSLTLDTAGYTITLGTNTSVKAGGILPASSEGLTTIAGSGTVVANYDVDDLSTSAGSKVGEFTVANGATLALMSGSDLGTGLLTVADGGALEVAESGAVTLGGDLILNDGATLAFNWTKRAVAPQIAVADGKTLSFVGEGEKNIAVKVSGDLWPVGGEYLLTTSGEIKADDSVSVSLAEGAPKWAKRVYVNDAGNIVLDVKTMGTKVIVK